MGEHSKIEWTDHTFNPWVGCTKVSPGCAHCYAERDMDQRRGFARWGAGQPRVRTSASNWQAPVRWDRAAAAAGKRARVFCASLADVFDDEVPVAWLADLLALIDRCKHLDWLLLTKRPENIRERLDEASNGNGDAWNLAEHMPNVWLGTSVEDQQRADERIPHLLGVPARVRFLSCEPLLGPVNLEMVEVPRDQDQLRRPWDLEGSKFNALTRHDENRFHQPPATIDWVIAGGESGPQARPMRPAWARSLRDQCRAAGVAFFFKQWGEWLPLYRASPCIRYAATGEVIGARVDGIDYGPDRIECDGDGFVYVRVGKRAAGRNLGGVTWDALPAQVTP